MGYSYAPQVSDNCNSSGFLGSAGPTLRHTVYFGRRARNTNRNTACECAQSSRRRGRNWCSGNAGGHSHNTDRA